MSLTDTRAKMHHIRTTERLDRTPPATQAEDGKTRADAARNRMIAKQQRRTS
ncbi:TPA: hypothetical protein QHQ45_000361 [Enterobacter hormaechei subsp. xiangfangensis]|nr:hypothetical protein [Enterobacter hormaechei subsp. xiangfangensis]